jgi:sulfatase maturation enzyme AslB (radical SAM superfamily)
MIERLHPKLPLFGLSNGERHVLYAPGHLAVVTPAQGEAVRAALLKEERASETWASRTANRLRQCAQSAVQAWNQRVEAAFSPECLTVYLSNRCNCACPYCFARAPNRTDDAAPIAEGAVLSASRQVAGSCASKNRPLQLVLHGGGEPAIHWGMVTRLRNAVRRIAEEARVDWWGFIATNGTLSRGKAVWLARNFDLVGLACDGPPDIQNRQRPLIRGGDSSRRVERTARALAGAGGKFSVRTTITPQTVERQAEIVAYLHEQLGATQIRFEPVYGARRPAQAGFRPDQAGWFVQHFLAAQREAQARKCNLTLSGVRLNEIHGPYCSVLAGTLHLLPGGVSTACFLRTDAESPGGAALQTGRWDAATDEYVLDRERIATLRGRAGEIPERCKDCINSYHCARDCPEFCYLSSRPIVPRKPAGADPSEVPGFRCRVHRQLGENWVWEAAAELCGGAHGITSPPW